MSPPRLVPYLGLCLFCLTTLACGSPDVAHHDDDITERACELSPLGRAVVDAAMAAEPSRNTVPAEWLSLIHI